jgi:hypothetical protein
VICNFTEYRIEKEKTKDGEIIGPIDWKAYLTDLYSQLMMDILIGFIKVSQKFNLKSYPNDEFQDTRVKDYYCKAIYHFWVYLYLLQHNISNNAIIEKIELIGLNSLKYMGIPDSEFETYLKTMSSTYNDSYFNPYGVVRLKDNILEIMDKPTFNKKYFVLDHSGLCKFKEIIDGQVFYKSLYGKNQISLAKYKDLKNKYFRI